MARAFAVLSRVEKTPPLGVSLSSLYVRACPSRAARIEMRPEQGTRLAVLREDLVVVAECRSRRHLRTIFRAFFSRGKRRRCAKKRASLSSAARARANHGEPRFRPEHTIDTQQLTLEEEDRTPDNTSRRRHSFLRNSRRFLSLRLQVEGDAALALRLCEDIVQRLQPHHRAVHF